MTHSGTAGEAAAQEQWTRQLEVWAIDEMVEATAAQLSEADAERGRGLQATEEAPQHREPAGQ